jgi:hypothetical protein
MTRTSMLGAIAERQSRTRRWIWAAALLLHAAFAVRAVADDQLFLVSTRQIGLRCEPAALLEGLVCERFVRSDCGVRWEPVAWSEVYAELARPTPSIVYVHGNRVDRGGDRVHGEMIFRTLAGPTPGATARTFVIWSWPSDRIPGPLKDYRVKASRTRQVAWQLAWTLDRLPHDADVTLIGYSYGARVVSGALHLLAGGTLDGLGLPAPPAALQTADVRRRPMKAALLAAAFDADEMAPWGSYGRALELVSQAVVITNRRDPAMRFYALSTPHSRQPAIGYEGPQGLGGQALAQRVRAIDVTRHVGPHHALAEYLNAAAPLRQLLAAPASPRTLRGAAETFAPPQAEPASATL